MKIQTKKNEVAVMPVKKYAAPKYPTYINAARNPEFLKKLPARWQKNAIVAAAAGFLGAIALASCGGSEPGGSKGYNPGSESFLNVAPIFAYGDGTGSIGCDMVAPPVFLSEQEALAIIKSETEATGLKFNSEPPGYTATKNKTETQYSWEQKNKYVLGDGNLGLDLYDGKNKVAVTYISMENAAEIYPGGPRSSVDVFRPRELAELTAEDFAEQKGDIAVGVFYDPGPGFESEEHRQLISELYNGKDEWPDKLAQYQTDAQILAEENLRAQIRDFIEWLQGQGII